MMPERGARKKLRVAGLMSGTSADGVTAAIVDISGRDVELLAFHTVPYPPPLRRRIFNLFRPETGRVDAICGLNFVLGEFFAEALVRLTKKSAIPLRSLDLIGSHGQTIYHIPRACSFGGRWVRSTLQIGEPCVIAERTGITTVADFRPRDIAAGGEGAPLVPYADYVLFRHPRRNRAIQNIGGIANVTYLPRGCRITHILAFDTGPGNMVIDRVACRVSSGRRRFHYDPNGRMAARGKVDTLLLAQLMRHKFLCKRPPKSTGREAFGAPFSDEVYEHARRKGIRPFDILATVTAFTARSIAEAYRRFLPGAVDEVILSGGGTRNRTLVRMLQEELRPARVILSDELGIAAEAKEAVSFAILARETIRGVPNSVPSATGARGPVVLGKVIPGRC